MFLDPLVFALGKCSQLLLQPQVNWLTVLTARIFATEQDRRRVSGSFASGCWSQIPKGVGKRVRLRGQNGTQAQVDDRITDLVPTVIGFYTNL